MYVILRMSPHSSGDDVKRAVRDMYTETHTDNLKRHILLRAEEDNIEEESKLVVGAADVMFDLEKR